MILYIVIWFPKDNEYIRFLTLLDVQQSIMKEAIFIFQVACYNLRGLQIAQVMSSSVIKVISFNFDEPL